MHVDASSSVPGRPARRSRSARAAHVARSAGRLASVPWVDNHRIMELKQLPSHLIILGGGYIGCEFAQMFRRFGSAVTIVSGRESGG